MNKAKYILRCAPIAIAAVAALPATMAGAQQTVEPVIILEDPAPAQTTQSSPTIVLPEPDTTVSSPSTATDPAATSAATSTAEPARSAATESTAEPASTRELAADEPVSSSARRDASVQRPAASTSDVTPMVDRAMSDLGEAPPIADGAEMAPAIPLNASAEPVRDTSGAAILFGFLAALAVAAIAFLAMRRRRSVIKVPEIERPIVRTPSPAAVVPVIDREPRVTSFDEPMRVDPGRGEAMATTAAVPLPTRLPDSYEERDALLRRMVDAEPDRANPFRSRRARARRARLILQSLDRRFERRKPRIDLSQYTNNWPALRGWHPATA